MEGEEMVGAGGEMSTGSGRLKRCFPLLSAEVVEGVLEAVDGDEDVAYQLLCEMVVTEDGDRSNRRMEELMERFPALSREVVDGVLEAAEGDEDVAFDMLCDMVAEAPLADDPVERETKLLIMAEENTKRCHKMNEKAREKRWNRISMEQLEGSTSPELSLLLRNKWNAGPTSLAAKMQIERLRRKYPWAETEVLEDILRSEENDVQRTEERLLEMFPVDDFVATAELDVETGSGNETAQLEGSNAPLVQKEVVSSTGAINSKQLEQAWHRLRVTRAELDGSQSLAVRTKQPRIADEAVGKRQAYERSHQELMAQLADSTSFRENQTIDLHGANVEMALDLVRLKMMLERKHKEKYGESRTITIITGRGSSSNGKVKIRPAVTRYLDGEGYRYKLDNSGGALIVRIQ